MTSNSYYSPMADQPLFGETRFRDRVSFAIVTLVSAIFVLATFVGMFLFHHFSGTHLFLNICLLLLLCSHVCLAVWYRSGEMEPRILKMLYFNTTVIVLLCICANLIISGRLDHVDTETHPFSNLTQTK